MAAALLLAAVFSFAGGSDPAMVRAVGRECDWTVCVLVDPDRRWPSSRLEYSRIADIRNVVRGRFDLSNGSRDNASGPLWSVGAYPVNFFYKQRLDRYVNALAEVNLKSGIADSLAVIDPNVVKYLTLEQISARLRKPIKASWFFDGSRLSIWSRNLPDSDLARAVARALGGTLSESEKQYDVEIDPAAVRARAIRLFQWEASTAPSQSALIDARYHEELYSSLTETQIRRVYATPTSELRLAIVPGTRLFAAAEARLWQRIGAPEADETTLPTSQTSLRRHVLERADFSKGMLAVVRPDGVPTCMVQGMDQGKAWSLGF